MQLVARLVNLALGLLVLVPAQAFAAYGYEFEHRFLRIVQVSDDGALRVNVFAQEVGVAEGGGSSFFFAPVDAIEVVMLDESGTKLEVAFEDALAGALSLELGNGERLVEISGDSPEIGGDFVVHGGSDLQTVTVTASQPLHASGDIVFDGVNSFTSPSVPVESGGDLLVSSRRESARMEVDLFYLDLEGDFDYQGTDDLDYVELGYGDVEVRGSFTVDLGDGVSGDGYPYFQVVRLSSGMNGSPRIVGRFSVRGGDVGNPDFVEIESGTELLRGARIDLGDGENHVLAGGTGGALVYAGGSGPDTVELGLAAPAAKLKLGGDSDTLSLVAPLALGKLAVDFGAGTDTYEIEVGLSVPAGAKVKNLP